MSRKNLVLLAVFALVIGIVVLKQKADDRTVAQHIKAENETLFTAFNPADIKEMVITDREKKTETVLAKETKGWVVKNKNNYPAEQALVDRMLEVLPKIRKGTKIADYNPQVDAQYGFDKGVAVKVKETLFVFGETKGMQAYLMTGNTIYLSPGNEKNTFSRYDGEYRERALFPGKKEDDVTAVTIIQEGKPEVKIALDDKNGIAVSGIDNADQEKAKTFLKSIAALRITSFMDAPAETEGEIEKEIPAKAGANNAKPQKVKEPVKKGMLAITFRNGESAKLELAGLKIKNKGDYLIKKDGTTSGLSEFYYNRLANPDITSK